MSKKPLRHAELLEVVYDVRRWEMLKGHRQKASTVMEALEKSRLESIVHGSITRGDVTEKSDIDVFIANPSSSFTVEAALEKANVLVARRLVVQATPTYAMKAYLEIGEDITVSFPLMKMRKVEREFYKFGGEATLEDMRKNLRLRGVDKRLMLIEPTEEGHRESSIVGREDQTAKVLGISIETILDRVHALLRRGDVGRTGVFMKQELQASETFEMALARIASKNPAVRRRLTTIH